MSCTQLWRGPIQQSVYKLVKHLRRFLVDNEITSVCALLNLVERPSALTAFWKSTKKRVFDVGGGPAKRKLQRKRISKTLTPFRELTRRTALPRLVDKVSFTRSFCFPIFASQRRKAVSHKHDPYKSSQLLLCTLKTRMSCILCKVIATKIVVSISKPKKSIEQGANTSSWSSTSYHEIMNAFH